MCWARAFIDSFCRQNWMSFLKASMEKICDGGKTCRCCCWVAVALVATVLHVDIRGGWEKTPSRWYEPSELLQHADFLRLHWLSFHPVLRHAIPTMEFHIVPWSFRFQGFQLPPLVPNHPKSSKHVKVGLECLDTYILPPNLGNTQNQRWISYMPIEPIQILYIESVPTHAEHSASTWLVVKLLIYMGTLNPLLKKLQNIWSKIQRGPQISAGHDWLIQPAIETLFDQHDRH